MSVLQIKRSTLQILIIDSHDAQQNMPLMQTKRLPSKYAYSRG